MAELLIQQWRLSVLRVRLDLASAEPSIDLELVGYEGSMPRTLWTRSHGARDFGIPQVGPPSRLQLPADLVDAVGRSFSEELGFQTALWLRLVPPYGFLGAAPWEQSLVPLLQRPVLRVPDRLPLPTDFGSVWTAVVVVAAAPGSDWAAGYVESFAAQLRGRVAGEVEVHVFADAGTTDALGTRPGSTAGCVLHTAPAHGSASWTEWIRSGLAGCSARSLHLVTDAEFDGDIPTLLLGSEPTRTQGGAPRFVPVDALVGLSDALGVTTLSFGSPPGNRSVAAGRMLADSVGATRPGPTVFSDLELDPGGSALAAAYAYIADRSALEPVPQDPSLFLYLQPEHVRSNLMESWPKPDARTTSAGDEILPSMPSSAGRLAEPDEASEPQILLADAREVPAWIASSHQYLTNSWARLAKSAPLIEAPDDLHSAYQDGAAQALEELQALIREHGAL
jgi:hypothetical protein